MLKSKKCADAYIKWKIYFFLQEIPEHGILDIMNNRAVNYREELVGVIGHAYPGHRFKL